MLRCKIFSSVRTRILAWYVVLMLLSTLVSIMAIRQVFLARLQERVEEALIQDVENFRRLTRELNSTTAQPFRYDVAAIFDVFLSRNIPENHEVFIALLNGQVYQSRPEALPVSLRSDLELIKHWAQLIQPERGKRVTPNDTIFYLAEPKIAGKTRGVFVVAYSNRSSREVDRAVVVIIEVMMAVVTVVSLLAWVLAGRVLAPLRLLTKTAQSINESDLTRRIPMQGVNEIAELTITFNEMLDRLQAAFANQSNFIKDVSHELRTPITIIQGHLELLGNDPQERRETVEIVTTELDRMRRFVNDLLLLAKAEQPNFLTLKTVNISLLTEDLYAKARVLAKRDWILENKGTGHIAADHQRLTQAAMNLAQNAAQHTKDNDVIALGSALKDGKACFWVRDTGDGIALADQQQIFQRFNRGSYSHCRFEGTGLGLAIVNAIVSAHGGWVELKSRPADGSTFTIVIPLD
ncbi:MAG: HAMP domain-containing histidine kinase [Chroococcidiopsidaceae cyanobacterium CP_BM_RX_35]|nr:HAMP domain-containing histidine kinase [Chroococcidiopsidaceae cyanobacterium CP_BM_RX_35]